jgi:hypothetical protein
MSLSAEPSGNFDRDRNNAASQAVSAGNCERPHKLPGGRSDGRTAANGAQRRLQNADC